MRINPVLLVPAILLTSAIIIFSLLKFTAQPNERPNGFSRIWLNHALSPLTKRELNPPLRSICGVTEEYILFTTSDKRWLIRLDTNLKSQDTFAFGLTNTEKLAGASLTIAEPPIVYFLSNNYPGIFRGRWDIKSFDTLYKPATAFTRAIRIPPNHILLRILDTSYQKQIIQKINLNTGIIEASTPLFDDQKMGGFDKDGSFAYDSINKKVFYVEQFRNKFYCLDSQLNLAYTAHSIDTFQVNYVEMEWVTSEGETQLMPKKARTIVNWDCLIHKENLYIRSKVKADNETLSQFKNNSVIDIYNSKNGKYKGSFYIPTPNGEALQMYTIINNRLIALYKKEIASFRISI